VDLKIGLETVAALVFTVKDGQTLRLLQEQTSPQEFLIGHDLLIEGFEQNLIGLSEGDRFNIQVKADQAYGPIDPEAIFDLPLSTFAEEDGHVDDDVVQVGHIFPMEDKDGNKHFGKIIRKMKDRVTMDFNPPYAGKDLLFEGQVVSVRHANESDK
jgi:FKBP-type peptidyl-prolyl cis-trans isomerase SlyD